MLRILHLAIFILVVGSLAKLVDAGPITNRVDRLCNTNVLLSPSGAEVLPSAQTATASLNANIVRCGRVTMQCTGTFTQLGFRVSTGAATCGDGNNNCMCGVAIYNRTGTAILAQSSATEACNVNATTHTTTGITAFTLQQGTEYLMCYSASNATVSFSGLTTAFDPFIGATGPIVDGQNAAASKSQFNSDCSAAATPNACCSGDNAGTCAGFPATLGTLATPGNDTYAFIAARP